MRRAANRDFSPRATKPAPISEQDALMLNGGVKPDLHWWWRWSFLIGIGLVIVGPVLALILNP